MRTADFWSALTAAALVGTARTSVPTPSGASAQTHALAALLARTARGPLSPERCLLTTAGVTALWHQAGTMPAQATTPLPEPVPATSTRTCSAEAEVYLTRLLDGEESQLLPEWLAAAGRHGLCPPPRRLPELLDTLAQHPELIEYVAPVLDVRGRWLAAQNPAWTALFAPPAAEHWESGSRDERLAYLRWQRAADPAAARSLVEAVWQHESAADRAAFATVLGEAPTYDDEPFFEAALDDRSKRVRAAAVEALLTLPESALVARQTQRAATLLRLERGLLGRTRLVVTLPSACEAAWERDGVIAKALYGGGQRAWWLQQIVAAVPPQVWSREWQLTPEEIVRLAKPTDYAPTLLSAWSQATARARDASWAMALLHNWAGEQDRSVEYLPGLCRAVPAEELDPWLTQQIRALYRVKRIMIVVLNDLRVIDLLKAFPYPWSEALTRAVLDTTRVFARNGEAGAVWAWHTALPEFALSAAPALASEAERDWPDEMPDWRDHVQRFQVTLRFRYEMLRTLAQDALRSTGSTGGGELTR